MMEEQTNLAMEEHIYGSTTATSSTIRFKHSKPFLQIFTLLILALSPISVAATVVHSLPGYPGDLPFRLETGYIGVGEKEEVQLFYYFIESEAHPKTDPILAWFTGGAGCSSLSGLLFQMGPLKLNYSPMSWHSEVPKLELNPYSWTKFASIIFVDSPVGAGFSYATTSEASYSDDITASRHSYELLKKWLVKHAEFQKNSLYIGGDSYSGITVPIVVQNILNGNKAGTEPLMNLKGYVLGNPHTETEEKVNSRYKFAHRVSLLSDKLYKATRVCSHGNYEIDAGKSWCEKILQAVKNDLDPLYIAHILEPKCNTSITPKWCRDNEELFIFKWANDLKVQEALHIREGTKMQWVRCNRTSSYTRNVESSFNYHLNFTKELFHALIYSGDQDMVVPYLATIAWIRKLNLSIVDRWGPWFAKGQVAGYTTKYSSGHYHLTFATVKGAGHTGPEYKPRECLSMLSKWFKMHPL